MSFTLANKLEPFLTHRFSVFIDGINVSNFSSVQGLGDITEVEEWLEGGSFNAKLLPKRTRCDPVTLIKGVVITDVPLLEWRNQIFDIFRNGKASSSFRRNVIIRAYSKDRREKIDYKLYNCWPSSGKETTLDAMQTGILFRELTLQCEGKKIIHKGIRSLFEQKETFKSDFASPLNKRAEKPSLKPLRYSS